MNTYEKASRLLREIGDTVPVYEPQTWNPLTWVRWWPEWYIGICEFPDRITINRSLMCIDVAKDGTRLAVRRTPMQPVRDENEAAMLWTLVATLVDLAYDQHFPARWHV